ncbi:MAG: hypothetical protein R3A79_02970 [Nannocystaceae bacterium]
MPVSLRSAAKLAGALLLLPLLSACPQADLGAPCNHGSVEPPDSKLVTFPALSCNDLLCIYADESKAPTTPCTTDDECNAASPDVARFACVDSTCELSLTYVLQRSMCSKRCESDSDCADGGPTEKVLADDTSCNGSFRCVIIQQLGEFCCERLCVCEDDISDAVVDQLATDCAEGRIMCDSDEATPAATSTGG